MAESALPPATLFLWLVAGLAMVALLVAYWVLNRHGRLDCGCVNDGSAIYGCVVCGFTRCIEHRYVAHDCGTKIAAGSENTDG